VYRADGVKLKKLFGDIETNYLDGFQYKSTKPSETSAGGGLVVEDPDEIAEIKLRMMPTSEGYYDFLSNEYIYNYTDHLGNVRLSYSDSNKDGAIQPRRYFYQQCSGPWDPFNPPICIDSYKPGEIVEVNNYYPFGLLHNYTGTTQNAYQYKYNGKELQETGMYDYGARFYMPEIGRWGVVDPLAEASRRFSPYVYGNNNPVRFIDPDGRITVDNLSGQYSLGSAVAGFINRNGLDENNLPLMYTDDSGIMTVNTALGNDGQDGGGGKPSIEELLAMLEPQSEYFKGIDFSQFTDDDPPGNSLSRFREKSANWVQDNIREPLSSWFDNNTRNIFTLDAAGQARMDDMRGQMSGYMSRTVGGGIRWGAEHGLIGSGLSTGNIGAFRQLNPNRVPFKAFSEMTEVDVKSFQHAISRHGKDFGLNWSRKNISTLVDSFNTAASEIRRKGGFTGYQRIQYGVRGSGKSGSFIEARTFEMVKTDKCITITKQKEEDLLVQD